MKSLIILIIGAVVIGMSVMTVAAEEPLRENEIPSEEILIEEQNSEEEPILIAPSPDTEPLEDEPNLIAPSLDTEPSEEEVLDEQAEILPIKNRDILDPSDTTIEDGSEMSLISQAESDSSNSIKNAPAIVILGVVGFLVILLLVINRKK